MLTAEQYAEVRKALDTPGAIKNDAYRSWALEQTNAYENQNLQGWAGAGPNPAADKPAAPGALGVQGIIGQEDPEEQKAAELAGKIDPRFDVVPQVLALQPGTNDPRGDRAVAAEWEAGAPSGQTKYVYEPSVGAVRKQLLENPAFVRALFPTQPPEAAEIANMDEGSSIYRAAADYMWRKTAEAASAAGTRVVRYSRAPYLFDDNHGVLDQLSTTVKGAKRPALDAANAFVLGVDDTAALGAGRAAQETLQPETQMTTSSNEDVMGLNEQAPQKTSDLNQWNLEQHPIAYGVGQLAGGFTGAPEMLWRSVMNGGGRVAELAARTRLGGLASELPKTVQGLGRVAGETAAGAVANAGVQAGQEGVDMAAETLQSGELPSSDRLAEAGERVKDVGTGSLPWAAGGALAARLAHSGAERLRDSERFGGKIRATEPNVDWGATSVVAGPRLQKDTRELVQRARREGIQPGDYIAEDIAPPIKERAQERALRLPDEHRAAQQQFYQAPEGGARQPLLRLQQAALERVRDFHQPTGAGAPIPVAEGYRESRRVFNRLAGEVTTAPMEGAVRVPANEVDAVLSPIQQARVWQHERAELGPAWKKATARSREPIHRDDYLQTLEPRQRRLVSDEIDDEIASRLTDAKKGDRDGSPEWNRVEQQVLHELVAERAIVEDQGPLGKWLEARGRDVYVRPIGVDARRTEALIGSLKDPELIRAAKLDRFDRPMNGEPGEWARTRDRQDAALAEAQHVADTIAPKGDAFRTVVRHGTSTPGEKPQVDLLRKLAGEAGPGVREKLDKLRALQDTLDLRNQAWFRSPGGQGRNFGPQSWIDATQLRTFPVLRYLEGSLGPHGGALPNYGAPGLLGQQEDVARREVGEASARSRYEQERAKRLEELDRERQRNEERRRQRRQERRR